MKYVGLEGNTHIEGTWVQPAEEMGSLPILSRIKSWIALQDFVEETYPCGNIDRNTALSPKFSKPFQPASKLSNVACWVNSEGVF